jgi:Uma2 family endonuclease
MPRPRDGEFLRVVPDLVVEILSGSTAGRDRVRKRRIYERNGVREYWLVDPGRRTILVLTRHAGKFDTGTTYTGTAIVRSTLLPGIAFSAERIFPSSRPG